MPYRIPDNAQFQAQGLSPLHNAFVYLPMPGDGLFVNLIDQPGRVGVRANVHASLPVKVLVQAVYHPLVVDGVHAVGNVYANPVLGDALAFHEIDDDFQVFQIFGDLPVLDIVRLAYQVVRVVPR